MCIEKNGKAVDNDATFYIKFTPGNTADWYRTQLGLAGCAIEDVDDYNEWDTSTNSWKVTEKPDLSFPNLGFSPPGTYWSYSPSGDITSSCTIYATCFWYDNNSPTPPNSADTPVPNPPNPLPATPYYQQVKIVVDQDWDFTTYYTPREESFDEPKTIPITATHYEPYVTNIHLNVSADFKSEVDREGWGRLDSPYGGEFICFNGDSADIRPNNPRQKSPHVMLPLSTYSSCAYGDGVGIDYGDGLSFSMKAGNGWPGGAVPGVAHDCGEAINDNHLDFYVGIRAWRDSNESDAYDNNQSDRGPLCVTHQD